MATGGNFDFLENSEAEYCLENLKDEGRIESFGNEEERNEISEGEDKDESDTEDLFEKYKNFKLTLFFRDILNKRVYFQISNREVRDIISTVDTLVHTIVAKVTSTIDWLPFSRVVKVGSMVEQTSIECPDEFDYLAVIEIEGMEAEKMCEGRRGYAHIKVVNEQLRLKCSKWLRDSYLKGSFKRESSKNEKGYFDTLGNALMNEVAKLVENPNDKDLVIKTETGKMRPYSKIEMHGPAITLTFIWRRYDGKMMEIKVDITPAIEMKLTPNIVTAEDAFHPKFWAKLEEHGKYMLVPCNERASCDSGLCFRVTFTETEVELVQDLSEHHKDCYKLLKYFFNSGDWYKYFPSYAWKTLVLKHDCHCKEQNNLAECFFTLVASCLHYLSIRETEERIEPSRALRILFRGKKFTLNIPSIFIKDHNIFHCRDFKIPCEQFQLGIERMLESLEEISKCDDPDDTELKIVSSVSTAVLSYVNTLPIFNKDIEIGKSLKCYETYFNENIL